MPSGTTREIRWFLEREHTQILRWFQSLPFESPEERVDYYLDLHKADVGAKYREGNIEIKQRLGTWSDGCLSPYHWGRFENYTKWSFALADAGATHSLLHKNPDNWLPVSKSRRVAILHPVGDTLTTSPPGESIQSGCQVEYGRVAFCEQQWHTIAFEFFGPEFPELPESLARSILGEEPLDRDTSMGYAEFLMKQLEPPGTQ